MNLQILGTIVLCNCTFTIALREIEKAIEPVFFEVVTDHQKASQIIVELAKSVINEALILLPRDKSMVRLDV
jgi:hypothetical protein